MSRTLKITGALVALTALAGCFEGTTGYRGPDSVIATGVDKGSDKGVLLNGRAAIAYDPDGCQNWIIDDGVEGYASPRYDPVSGLPICNSHYPPGTVLGDYSSGHPGIPDFVPGPGRSTRVVGR